MAKLNHPNVIGFHDAYRTPDAKHLDIIMEYADDGDLEAVIDQKNRGASKKFTEKELLSITY